MKTSILFLLLFTQFTIVQAEPKVDSLFQTGLDLLEKGEYEEARPFLFEALEEYTDLEDYQKIGETQLKLSNTFFYLEDYNSSIKWSKKSIDSFEKVQNYNTLARSMIATAAVYQYMGKELAALDYYDKVLKFEDQVNDKELLAALYQNLGSIYFDLEDTKSIEYMQRALTYGKATGDDNLLIKNLNGIGQKYTRKKDYSRAMDYFNQALELAIKVNDKQNQLEVFFNLGSALYEQGEKSQALDHFDKCMQLATALQNNLYIGYVHLALGEYYFDDQQLYKSIDHFQKSYALAEELQIIYNQRDASNYLYKAYKSIGDTKKALLYYEKQNALTDSLQIQEISNKAINMEFEKKMLRDSLASVEKENLLKIEHLKAIRKRENQRNILLGSAGFIILMAGGLWSRLRFVRKSKALLQIEKDRSEDLLLNILPNEIAQELKENGFVAAQDFERVTILFTDFKSFTQTSMRLSPQELVEEINVCFKAFDSICEKYKIEKIKTIGDAYMAAAGLPQPNKTPVKNVVLAALEMQAFITARHIENQALNKAAFQMRLGIHTGPLVAGVVGIKKFQYDVWGDTVNTASRIESNGAVGKVNISEVVYETLSNDTDFSFTSRGLIEVKGKGKLKMYFVEKTKHEPIIELAENRKHDVFHIVSR